MKGIEALEILKNVNIWYGVLEIDNLYSIPQLTDYFKVIEKKLKALEIIINKKVDVYLLLEKIKLYSNDYNILETYNNSLYCEQSITIEELELLKEVLEK